MKTEVVMKRELFGMDISQKSKSKFFSLTDLVRAGNKWRSQNEISIFDVKGYLNQKSTKEFISELESKYGKVKISGRGRGNHTWVHPYLFVDVALAISPKLKIETYEWLFDNLIKMRNESGDSYKKMCGALWKIVSNKSRYPEIVKKAANLIQSECGVEDWQRATEGQLKLRDKIHEAIYMVSDFVQDPKKCVVSSIKKVKSLHKED